VESSVSRGTWKSADREQLRELLPGLTPELRDEVVRSLIHATNTGRVRVESNGPLL
jgi:hypothetical protein